MSRFFAFLFLLVLTAPAFAKPRPSCGELWSALTETLSKQDDYRIVATDSERMRASFVIVGSQVPGVHAAFLIPRATGCEMEVKINFTGIDDEFALRERVHHVLAKRRIVKPSSPAASSTVASK
jgi:hypothetical protein